MRIVRERERDLLGKMKREGRGQKEREKWA